MYGDPAAVLSLTLTLSLSLARSLARTLSLQGAGVRQSGGGGLGCRRRGGGGLGGRGVVPLLVVRALHAAVHIHIVCIKTDLTHWQAGKHREGGREIDQENSRLSMEKRPR